MAKKNVKEYYLMHKDIPVLSYVQNRKTVDINKALMDFDIYTKDLYERQIRIPKLKELYDKKLSMLSAFQDGKDLWKAFR